ncbi:hypothetical protein [Ectothiorhodospira lacustris]|uniref:hypothetical protein n=1 Tax=Ectothiorhodospira lacustris TaxID=2899127 RepID=UPI001EE7A2C5|nr:hypothetical protein [Ectothiorhodospira lacustris]MCG5509631.1 hypothetical protein [Ectothiorhodospira lacustris]MCG5521574.1 hypothetical protein [Ectothiorhodospira lacustris]
MNVARAVELWRGGAGPDEIHRLTGIDVETLRDALAERRLIPPPAIDVDVLDRIADAIESDQPIPGDARQWVMARPWRRGR